jgi:serine/threonine protein kinase
MISDGTVLKGKYRVERLLKSGGMAFVYEGEYDGNKCIIKEPKHGEEIKEKNYFLEKIKIEAEILSKVKHDNIVGYIDSFEERNSFFLVEKYVEGEKLGDKYYKNPGSEKEVINYTLQLLDAINYLHNINIKHRDINPNNLILTPEKKLVLIDFGTAKIFNSGQEETKDVPKSTKVGTPYYTPPEQWEGDTSEVSDIFSVGRTMYFMLTGEHPTENPYRRLDFPGTKVHNELEEVVIKAAAPEAKDRYREAIEMIESLKRIEFNTIKSGKLEDIPKKSRKWITIGIGILAILIILFIVAYLLPRPPSLVVVDAPATAETGSPIKITWRVNSNAEYQTNHTAIHYGPESKSEPLSLTIYPNISNIYTGLIPATFSTNITINTPGVIYFRAHVIINNVNYWSDEKSIVVSEPPLPATPTIQVTSYPIIVKGDTNFTIRWKVSGGTPGQIRYTLVHWGWNIGGPNSEAYSRVSKIQEGYTPAEFSVELKAPSSGWFYFRTHAMVDNTDLYSPEYKITISQT